MIYESPDGGKTVYAREVGTIRDWDLEVWQSQAKQANDYSLFHKVFIAANVDPDIKDLLDQAKALYMLRHADQ